MRNMLNSVGVLAKVEYVGVFFGGGFFKKSKAKSVY